MSRYTTGIIAVVFAVCFSAFTAKNKSLVTKQYKVTGRITTTSPQRLVVPGINPNPTINCEAGGDVCKVSGNDITPTLETGVTPNYYYFQVGQAGVTPTTGEFQTP